MTGRGWTETLNSVFSGSGDLLLGELFPFGGGGRVSLGQFDRTRETTRIVTPSATWSENDGRAAHKCGEYRPCRGDAARDDHGLLLTLFRRRKRTAL